MGIITLTLGSGEGCSRKILFTKDLRKKFLLLIDERKCLENLLCPHGILGE
jgi:hypothetical protein